MRNPPPLLSLAIESALNNLSHIPDLSFLPEHILLEIFVRTLRAGKLNEKILKLFLATGNEEILSIIKAFNIQHVVLPVLPTQYSNNVGLAFRMMMDIEIGVLRLNLTLFM